MFERIKSLFTRKPPRDLRLLVHIRYKAGEERYKRVRLAPQFLNRMRQSFISAPLIREVRIYEERFYHHKSYADDFEVDEKLMAALAAGQPLTLD